MFNINHDIEIFEKAREFLSKQTPEYITDEIIDSYLELPNPCTLNLSLENIYLRILSSAQNANMKAGVIGGSIDGVENLAPVLYDFNPSKVQYHYSNDDILLLDEVIAKIKPRGKIRKDKKSLWPQYCRTILSASNFMMKFKNGQEFLDWVEIFYHDDRSFAAVPMILEAEIYGVAFPLACDFLKELGYSKYGKPDIHIKEIFEAASLTPLKASNYIVLQSITRIAKNVGKSAYFVDKLFWLIGSGFFYNHRNLGNKGKIIGLKKKFIEQF